MNIKITLSILSSIIGIVAFLPYIFDVIKKKTRPHIFTWLISSITQGTATVGIWYGKGGIGAIALTIGTFFVILVFFLSLRNGKKDIARIDIAFLTIALGSILIWWLLDLPTLSIFLVTGIRIIGYIPTFRKSYKNPWIETVFAWGAWAIGDILIILALEQYNLLTLLFVSMLTMVNGGMFVLLLVRRKKVPISQPEFPELVEKIKTV